MTNYITAKMEKKDVVKVTIILAVIIIIAILAVIFGKGIIEVSEPSDNTFVEPGQLPFSDIDSRAPRATLSPVSGKETWDVEKVSDKKQGMETLADVIDTKKYQEVIEATTLEVTVVEANSVKDAEQIEEDIIVKVENPNKHVHQYANTVVAPTCTSEGYTEHVCECGDSYTDAVVEASGHQYIVNVVAPTTTSQGYTEHTCTACGDSYKDNFVEALHSHSYNSHVVEATCENDGYTEHHCSCGDSYNDSYTEALGHAWNEAYCTRCGVANPNYVFPMEDTTAPESAGVDLGSGDWFKWGRFILPFYYGN